MGRSAILTLRHAAAPPKTAMDGMPSRTFKKKCLDVEG
jgi:hypothetical protein